MGRSPDAWNAGLLALLDSCRVRPDARFDLEAHDPRGPVPEGLDKTEGERRLAAAAATLGGLQERLYAKATWSVLAILQGQDAAGKDGTIKHVLSGINPQGVAVTSFKAPGPDALAHDFLWRVVRALPPRGTIGVFNRSHYEEVLVPRIHPAALASQRLPVALTDESSFWEGRLADIAAFETHLAREGTLVRKFFLNISRAEQKKRLLARLDDPDRLWKFDPGDLDERDRWDAYRAAYAAAIGATATAAAPWFVIPADRKWLMRLLIAEALIEALQSLDLRCAQPDPDTLTAVAAARRHLEDEP